MTNPQALAFTWIAATVAIVVLNILLPQPFGLSAMGAVLEQYLVLIALVAGIAAIRSFRPAERLVVVALLVALVAITLPRYVPAWISPVALTGTEDVIRVATWNMHAGPNAADRALKGISSSDAQIMAMEELGAEAVAALEGQASRFPYTALTSDTAFLDVGLLSEYPILETQRSTNPPFLRAVVDPPSADPIVVYAVHIPLARLVYIGGIPVGVDFSVRDKAIATVRSRVQEDLARNQRVIVLGDFNMTERERAYDLISSGLRDSHLDAGNGPGFSWRPPPIDFVPFGMLRIDYVFSTPDLQPSTSSVDCSLPSDHCRVDVELAPTD